MKNVKRLFALGMALTGCGNNNTNNAGNGSESTAADNKESENTAADNKEGENTAAGGSVYYLNFKPEQDEQWQALAKTYTEQTGTKVTVVTAASGNYETTLMSEMGKSGAPTWQTGRITAMISPVPQYSTN